MSALNHKLQPPTKVQVLVRSSFNACQVSKSSFTAGWNEFKLSQRDTKLETLWSQTWEIKVQIDVGLFLTQQPDTSEIPHLKLNTVSRVTVSTCWSNCLASFCKTPFNWSRNSQRRMMLLPSTQFTHLTCAGGPLHRSVMLQRLVASCAQPRAMGEVNHSKHSRQCGLSPVFQEHIQANSSIWGKRMGKGEGKNKQKEKVNKFVNYSAARWILIKWGGRHEACCIGLPLWFSRGHRAWVSWEPQVYLWTSLTLPPIFIPVPCWIVPD